MVLGALPALAWACLQGYRHFDPRPPSGRSEEVSITTARHDPFWDYFSMVNRDISIKNVVLILYRAVVLFTFPHIILTRAGSGP